VDGCQRPLDKRDAVNNWIGTLNREGDDWDPEIERKLRARGIFLLLVSRHLLSSVINGEIGIIRRRTAKTFVSICSF